MIKHINVDNNQILFEYDLMMKVNTVSNPAVPVNVKDTYKYSPEIYFDFVEESKNKNIDNSMVDDGIIYLDTDKNGRNYCLDSNSGLIYYFDNGIFNVSIGGNTSAQYDIFDVAYFRQYIVDPNFRNRSVCFIGNYMKEITALDYMGHKLGDIFSVPILEYTASTMKELQEIIFEINAILSTSKFFEKLWFRGQRQEYLNTCSCDTLQRLGLSSNCKKIPSLVPSLGRNITKENFHKVTRNTMYWIEAFKVWTLTQSEEFKDEFALSSLLYKELIKSLEPSKMAEFLQRIPYDISEYIFYQNHLEELSEILAMQQYGAYTSMLDITDDLDVALFFTQSFLNKTTKKYELCNPRPGNVIYVLAQGRGTCTVDISSHMFINATNDGIYKLPPRIANQKCGLLIGANNFAKNTYAYRIVAKIKLSGSDILTTKLISDMFPDMSKDSLYKTYFDAEPKLDGLYG